MTTKLSAATAVSKAKVQELYNFPTIVKKVGSVLEGDTWLALDTNRIWTYEKEKFVDYGIYTGKLKVTQILKGDIPSTKFLPGRSTRLITTSYTTKLNYKDGVYFNLTDSKLRVTLEEQVLTPLTSIVTIYPTIDEDGKTHRYNWIQLTGPEVAWLSPQSELKLSIQKPELGPEYSFRLILDRGTDHEQYHDVVLQDDVYDTVYLPNIAVKETSAVDSPGAGLTNFALVPAISPPGTVTINNPDFAVTWNNPSETYPAVYDYTDLYRYNFGRLAYLDSFNVDKTNFVSTPVDPYYDNVELLISFDGIKNTSLITDYSKNNFSITNPNNAVIATDVSVFGGCSINFVRDNDQYLQTPASNNLRLDGSKFTLECWINLRSLPVTTNNQTGYNTDTLYYIASSDAFNFFVTTTQLSLMRATNSINAVTTNHNFELNRWYHIALTRDNGNLFRLFIDGVLKHSNNYGDTFATNGVFNIGSGQSGTVGHFDGYIDDFRLTKDITRYTENFVVPKHQFVVYKPNLQDIYVFRTFYDMYGVGQYVRSVDKKVNFLANSSSSTVDGTDLINLNIASTANAVPNLVESRNISISTQIYQDINVFLRNPKTSTAGYNLISERILELVLYDSQPVEDTINIVNPKSSVTSAKIYQARSLTDPGNIITYFQI